MQPNTTTPHSVTLTMPELRALAEHTYPEDDRANLCQIAIDTLGRAWATDGHRAIVRLPLGTNAKTPIDRYWCIPRDAALKATRVSRAHGATVRIDWTGDPERTGKDDCILTVTTPSGKRATVYGSTLHCGDFPPCHGAFASDLGRRKRHSDAGHMAIDAGYIGHTCSLLAALTRRDTPHVAIELSHPLDPAAIVFQPEPDQPIVWLALVMPVRDQTAPWRLVDPRHSDGAAAAA